MSNDVVDWLSNSYTFLITVSITFLLYVLPLNLDSSYYRHLEDFHPCTLPNSHPFPSFLLLSIHPPQSHPFLHRSLVVQMTLEQIEMLVCKPQAKNQYEIIGTRNVADKKHPPPVIILPLCRSISKYSSIDIVGNL